MDNFEEKYGVKEDERTAAFHMSRRMFCIYQNKLYVAEPNLSYSHAVWFEKQGWISKENDKLMDEIVRGIVDDRGDIYFYKGYDFEINNEIESLFFSHLKELVEKLDLRLNCDVFGGLIKNKEGEIFSPRKKYGKLENLL